jgi:putative SOS response-associated peptidase YedK
MPDAPDKELIDSLRTRLNVVEDAVGELLALAGTPPDLISNWRKGAISGHSFHLFSAMNAIREKLKRPSWGDLAVERDERSTLSMYGRARLAPEWDKICRELGLSRDAPALNVKASWNIAPTDPQLIVAHRPGVGRVARLAHFGLIPGWAAGPKMLGAAFNAKSETMAEKSTFRGACSKNRRCLIVVDGWYEWQKGTKEPWTVSRADGKLITFGGLWERWQKDDSEEIYSCTIVTVEAGARLSWLHDREPLIISDADRAVWLGEDTGDVRALVKPFDTDGLASWRVSKLIWNVKNNSSDLAQPLGRD